MEVTMINLKSKLIERRTVELDPDLAKHYLNYNNYESQRPVKEDYVKELVEKISDGRFRIGNVCIASRLGGRDVMMDGQHVCHAVVECEETVPCSVEKYGMLNPAGLSMLFRQFDNKPRSLKDMIKAEANALRLVWSLDFTGIIVAAAKLDQRKGLTTGRKEYGTTYGTNKEKSVMLLKQYLDEGYHVASIMTNSHSAKHLWRAPVVYSMFQTYRQDEAASLLFWKIVNSGENLTKNMPQYLLREFLKNVNSPTSAYKVRKISNHEFIYRSISAWNAYRDNRSLHTLLYRSESDIPAAR
jgi:hypothetical protein